MTVIRKSFLGLLLVLGLFSPFVVGCDTGVEEEGIVEEEEFGEEGIVEEEGIGEEEELGEEE